MKIKYLLYFKYAKVIDELDIFLAIYVTPPTIGQLMIGIERHGKRTGVHSRFRVASVVNFHRQYLKYYTFASFVKFTFLQINYIYYLKLSILSYFLTKILYCVNLTFPLPQQPNYRLENDLTAIGLTESCS